MESHSKWSFIQIMNKVNIFSVCFASGNLWTQFDFIQFISSNILHLVTSKSYYSFISLIYSSHRSLGIQNHDAILINTILFDSSPASRLEKEMATHSSVLAWRIPGTGSLAGCRLWGCTESDMTEATQQQQQQQQQQVDFLTSNLQSP